MSYIFKHYSKGGGSLPALTAPTISISTDTVSWSAVSNAVCYGIYAGADNVGYTTSLSVNIKTLLENASKPDGTYAITVKAIGDGTNYGASTASNSINYTYTSAVTDLTGTSWRFNLEIAITSSGTSWYINYTANGNTCNRMYLNQVNNFVLCNNDDVRYWFCHDSYQHGWRNTSSQAITGPTIVISGGTDVTNATLISWLQANATRIS